jgi:predicted PurR-regulated permease PerM
MNDRTRYVLYGLGAVLLGFMLWFFSSIVTYIIISAILATMGRPLVRWLNRFKVGKIHLSLTISALITLILMGLFSFGFFRFMIPIVVNKFHDMSNIDFNLFLESFENQFSWLIHFFYGNQDGAGKEGLSELIASKVSSMLNAPQVTNLLGIVVGQIGSLFIALFSISFITFFFLREEGSFQKGIMLLVPTGYEERVEKSLDRISNLLNRYFIGIVFEVLIVMALDSIGLMIVGLSFSDAVLIGLICGLFNVIPYLGPWIGAFIGILIGFAIHINADFVTEVLPILGFMTIVFAAVQVIDNVLLQPLIYSSSVRAHPLEIFLVIMAAGSLAGVIGMIVAIPVYTILRVFGSEFLSNVKFIRKITEHMEKR